MESLNEFLKPWLGVDGDLLTTPQMLVRGLIIFVIALVYYRLGSARIITKLSAFDVVLTIVMGSMLSRALTGGSPFIPTVITSLVLIAIHYSLAYLTYFSGLAGKVVKGDETLLYEEGEWRTGEMTSHQITKHDIRVALRSECHLDDIDVVQRIYLERNGKISFVMKPG